MAKRYRGGGPLFNYQLLPLMGLKAGHRLPDEGTPIHTIDGMRFRVLPKGQGLSKGNKAHRTVAECPCCGEWFCAGHINQHIEPCEIKTEIKRVRQLDTL